MRKKRIWGKKMTISILNQLKLSKSNFKHTCNWSVDKNWNWTQQMCDFFSATPWLCRRGIEQI